MSNIDIESLLPEIEATDTPPPEPEITVTTDPPADKEPPRGEDGKFTGAEAKKEADKAPEAKPEPKTEAKPEPKERTIPLAAHLEERRALKAELDALRADLAALKNPPKAPAPEPDHASDPKGYTDHKVQDALEQLKALKADVAQTKETAQQATEQTQQQRFVQDIGAAEASFVKETPDYYDALAHVRQVRARQLQMFDPNITQEQIVQVIRSEEVGMAIQLARAGRNPITTAYELAKAYGYQPKAPAETLELPKVPAPKKLPPEQTLGSGDGGAIEEVDAESQDPFEDAFKEMFSRKRA